MKEKKGILLATPGLTAYQESSHSVNQQRPANMDFNICPILRELAGKFSDKKQPFKNVLLVAMQHILDTTVDMLTVMKEFGLKEAVIGGKKYSTHLDSSKKIESLGFTYIPDGHQIGYGRFNDCMQEVIHKIWFKALEKIEKKQFDLIIILDDGADLLKATPGSFFYNKIFSSNTSRQNKIIGIEQTRGGTNHPLFAGLPFPVINVAGSFAKTTIEYKKVADLIADKVMKLIHNEISYNLDVEPTIGVLGYGTMGKAIVEKFTKKGFSVIVYDAKQRVKNSGYRFTNYDNSAVLIANADIIVGCTGEDVTAIKSNLSALLYSRQRKWLISTGSKDIEFNTLLRTIQNETKYLGYMPDPLKTIHYENHVGAILEVVKSVSFYSE
jgi:S-adenosylhomocysteine hydrolase